MMRGKAALEEEALRLLPATHEDDTHRLESVPGLARQVREASVRKLADTAATRPGRRGQATAILAELAHDKAWFVRTCGAAATRRDAALLGVLIITRGDERLQSIHIRSSLTIRMKAPATGPKTRASIIGASANVLAPPFDDLHSAMARAPRIARGAPAAANT